MGLTIEDHEIRRLLLDAARDASIRYYQISGKWPVSDDELQREVRSYKLLRNLREYPAIHFETIKDGSLMISLKFGVTENNDPTIFVPLPVASER